MHTKDLPLWMALKGAPYYENLKLRLYLSFVSSAFDQCHKIESESNLQVFYQRHLDSLYAMLYAFMACLTGTTVFNIKEESGALT